MTWLGKIKSFKGSGREKILYKLEKGLQLQLLSNGPSFKIVLFKNNWIIPSQILSTRSNLKQFNHLTRDTNISVDTNLEFQFI